MPAYIFLFLIVCLYLWIAVSVWSWTTHSRYGARSHTHVTNKVNRVRGT